MITRVNEFSAKPGKEDALREYLASLVPVIEECDGCLYCHMLQGQENPSRFLILETWTDIPTHQLSVQGIDRKEFIETMRALTDEVSAEYFHS